MKKVGFTLVETLCVIVIIASMAAFLFPVFASAKKAAKSSTCLSNLFQIGVATQLYMADYDDAYPSSINGIERTRHFLGFGLGARDPSLYPDHTVTLGPYVKSLAVWRCPLDDGRGYIGGPPSFPFLFPDNGGSSYWLADLLDGQLSTSWANPSRQAFACDGGYTWHGGDEYSPRTNALFYDWHVAQWGHPNPQWMPDSVP